MELKKYKKIWEKVKEKLFSLESDSYYYRGILPTSLIDILNIIEQKYFPKGETR